MSVFTCFSHAFATSHSWPLWGCLLQQQGGSCECPLVLRLRKLAICNYYALDRWLRLRFHDFLHPERSAPQLYLWTAWLPIFCVDLWLAASRLYVAVTTAALVAFLFSQGRSLHKTYWHQLRSRALESARTKELELAKTAAEVASLAKSHSWRT